MYISKMQINNYRNFKDFSIDFNDGLNVIIGPNNVGKSNLIKAISIVLDSSIKKQLNIDDFNKDINLDDIKTIPPQITISITVSQSKKGETADDLVIG